MNVRHSMVTPSSVCAHFPLDTSINSLLNLAKLKVSSLIVTSHYNLVVLLEFIWAQEEAQNMGAWSFVEPHFRKKLGLEVSQLMLINLNVTCTNIRS